MYPNDFIKEYRYYLGRRIDVSYAQVLDIRTLPIGQLCEGTCQSSISKYLIVKSASPYL